MVGFNNKVAFLLLVIICFAFFVMGRRRAKEVKVWKSNTTFRLDNTIILTSIISFILILGTGFVFSFKNFYGFIEDSYFLHYIYAVKYGADLYGEIQYIYGPLCVYPVIWLDTLFGIPTVYSYYLILGLYQIVGIIMTSYVLSKFNLQERERKYILIVISIFTFPYTWGLNNSLLRYSIAPFFLSYLLLGNNLHRIYSTLFFVIFSSFLTLMYSPEIGLCYVGALSIWLVFDGINKKKIQNAYYLISSFFSFFILITIKPEYLSSVVQAGAGGTNFPFVPSLILLLFFLCLFTVSDVFGSQSLKIKDNYSVMSIELLFFSLAVAAMGRCDPGHIISFGLFLLVISYIELTCFFSRRSIVLIFLVCLSTFFAYQTIVFKSCLAQAVNSNVETIQSYINKDLICSKLLKSKLSNILDKDNNIISFDFSDETVTSIGIDNCSYYYLLENTNYIHTFYHHNPRWIGTKAGFDKEIESLNKVNAKYIVLPIEYENLWMHSNDFSILNILFCSYYPVRPYRTYNKALYGDLIYYLKTNYDMIDSNDNIVIMRRKTLYSYE